MASRTLPGLGLRAFYNVGEDGWGDNMNEDLRKLSILVMPVVFSTVTEMPDSPTDGDRHLLLAEGSNSEAEDSIILFDVDTWVVIQPSEGWEVYNIGDSTKYRYVGGSWIALEGGAVTAGDVSYDAGDAGDSNSTMTNVRDALDDLYYRIRNIDAGGGVDAGAVTYDAGTGGDSNSDETTVQAALDALYAAARVFPGPALYIAGAGFDESAEFSYVFTRPVRFGDMSLCKAYAKTAQVGDSNSGNVSITIQHNGVNMATIDFADGSNTGTFTVIGDSNSGDEIFAAGSRMTFVCPANFHSLAKISITLQGQVIL